MDWLVRGGIMMAPILVFSVIALGTFLERLWVLRRNLILPEEDAAGTGELPQEEDDS